MQQKRLARRCIRAERPTPVHFAHAIVAGVVQVETLPQAQLLFGVLSDNIDEQIASATKECLGALQFFKGIAVHVQDDTSGTNVLGTFYQTTCVL